MSYEDIKRWCHSEMRAPADSDIYRRAKTILVAIESASAPTWLSDVAEALGMVRPDGAPLALNWTQAIDGIRDLRAERDECREEIRQACIALADGFVPEAERAGAHLQGLPRLVAHAVEHRKLAIVEEDKVLRIAAVVNGVFNGKSPLSRERATKALAAVADALGVPF